MRFVRRCAVFFVFCSLGLAVAGVAQAQVCAFPSGQVPPAPSLDADGLLPPRHNPATVPPIDSPQTNNAGEMVPAVSMPAQTCTAIRLFDASQESERHYDLVNCLDGLTFGFGNWPQAELADFLGALRKDAKAESALISRFFEVFKAQPPVWTAFSQDAKFPNAQPDAASVREGIGKLLATRKLVNAPLKTKSDGTCASTPPRGTSLYSDHATWLVPTLQRAFRDPAVVAVQVRHWEKDVLEPADAHTRALGLPEEGVFLMAFYQSNPGQVPPPLRSAIRRGQPPATLPAGGRDWKWDGSDRPATLSGISLDRWHTLLVWQAMCPTGGDRFRIRNRNLKFFSEYLAHDFELPSESKQGMPSANRRENCDPARVSLRSKQ